MRLYKWIFLLPLLLIQACDNDKKTFEEKINTTKNTELSAELKKQVITSPMVVYEIDKKSYSIDTLPKGYKEKSGEDRFHFLKNYINYQIVLESLIKEQKKYAQKIEKRRKKVFDLLIKKGDNISELDRVLIFQKVVIDTIVIEILGEKDTQLNKKIEAFYNKNKEYYNYPNTVEISAITAKEKEKIEAIVDKLKREKITLKRFSSFSSRYSSSKKLKKDGGYIGKISAKSAKKEIFQILWDSNITEGFLDKIINLDNIYSVIYIHHKEKAFIQPLKKESDEIKRYLLTPKVRKWVKNRINKIMKIKEVKIYDDFKDKNISK